MPSKRCVRKRNRPGNDTCLMPYFHVTDDTVSERQRKRLVTKRCIPGIKERQSDQRSIVDSERDHSVFSEYQRPRWSCPQNLKNSDQCHSSDMHCIHFFVISASKYFSTFQLYVRSLKTELTFILHYISQTYKKSWCFIDWFGQSRSFFYHMLKCVWVKRWKGKNENWSCHLAVSLSWITLHGLYIQRQILSTSKKYVNKELFIFSPSSTVTMPVLMSAMAWLIILHMKTQPSKLQSARVL